MVELFSFFKNIRKYNRVEFHENLNDSLLAFILIAMPLSIKVTNYILFLLALNWLLYFIVVRKKRMVPKGFLSIAINIAPFLFAVISLVYCMELIKGLHAIEKFLPLLAFPVILATMGTKKDKQFFLRIFAFTLLLISITCFIYGLYNFIFVAENKQLLVGDFFNSVQTRWNALTNVSLMRPFSINPIYMSLYVSLAFYILLFEKFSSRIVKVLVICFLVLFQFLVGSRIGLFAFFIALIVVLFQLRTINNKLYFSVFASLIFVLSVIIIFLNPVLKKRFITDLSAVYPSETVEGWNALNIRVAIWDCSLNSIERSPIWGYGVSSQYAVREKCYTKNYSFYGPYGTDLNSHNQYLEFALIGGVLLLALFIVQLAYSIKTAIRTRSRLHLIFIVLFVVICCGESLLETHKGIVFFALFNSLFIYSKNSETNA